MRYLLITLILYLMSGGISAQKREQWALPEIPQAPANPPMEFLGVECPTGTKLFMLDDLPEYMRRSGWLVARQQWAERFSPDTIADYKSECRFLTYIKINFQGYGYMVNDEKLKKWGKGLVFFFPLIGTTIYNANPTTSGLRLVADYTLCVYDTQGVLTSIQHPFVLGLEQNKEDSKEPQIMQPEGVIIEYPLVDLLQHSIVAEYAKICREYGLTE